MSWLSSNWKKRPSFSQAIFCSRVVARVSSAPSAKVNTFTFLANLLFLLFTKGVTLHVNNVNIGVNGVKYYSASPTVGSPSVRNKIIDSQSVPRTKWVDMQWQVLIPEFESCKVFSSRSKAVLKAASKLVAPDANLWSDDKYCVTNQQLTDRPHSHAVPLH